MFEHILFAYNNLETRNILYEIFTNLGYRITTAPTHKEVLETLKKERPDYIFLDPTIPDIPAEIVLEKVKIINGNIKVIILRSDENNTPQMMAENILKILREKHPSSPNLKETKGIQFKADILVVDDEKESAQLLKNYLSKRGYNVDIALSGEEAILKINIAKPCIVLLDIYMPGIDGLLVLKTIKDIDKSIIVIMTSVVQNSKIIKETLQLGANGYLVKPFNISKLEAMILNNALQKSYT